MSDRADRTVSGVGHVTVRYWAAARAAAGVDAEPVPVEEGATLADVLTEIRSRHGARSRLAEVLAVCSVLVGDRPVGSRAPEDVRLAAGDTVELLPPFAGG